MSRNFSLYKTVEDAKAGMDIGTYTGKEPRNAALKAATRGFTDIILREHGTKKLHIFRGSVSERPKPANGPAWLKDIIKVPTVKKVGTQHLG